MRYIDLLAVIAATLCTTSFIPQITKIYRERSARDISLKMYITYCLGVVLWVIYGILIHSPVIIIAKAATALFSVCVLIMKIHLG